MTTLNDLNGYLDDEAYTVRVGELRALLSASIADTAGAKPLTNAQIDEIGVKVGLMERVGKKQVAFAAELSATEMRTAIRNLLAAPPAPSVADAAGASETVAARDVLAERQRQMDKEGWTPKRDDRYINDELALAAIVYAESAVGYHPEAPDTWPWHPDWFKPTTPRRDLVKAGALIIAEIERLDRAAIVKEFGNE